MFEHKKEKLASKKVYQKRLGYNGLIAISILFASLCIGVAGYYWTVPAFSFYDSLLNASMILSGMGPVIDDSIALSNSAKLFASAYALFSGIAFLSAFSVLIAPALHRFFHKMHLEE